MNTDKHRWETNQITEVVIRSAFNLSNVLGSGFLEKVYENALAIEIRKSGLIAVQQHPMIVKYEQAVVGEFVADLLVQNEVLVELKAAKALAKIHLAQRLNYLKATALRICRLINLGTPKVEIKRVLL